MLPLISVVIPTRNRAQLLCRAIRSVVAQTYDHVEVVVVDDGSTEDLSAPLRDLAMRDVELRVLRNDEPVGAQRARLQGVMSARGDFVALLDSDDWWDPQKLARQQATLRLNPGALVSCRMKLATTGEIIPSATITADEKVEHFVYVRGGFLQSSTFFSTRELLREGLSHTLHDAHNDTSLAMYLRKRGVSIVQLSEPLSYFDDFPRPDRKATDEKSDAREAWFRETSEDWSPEAKAGYLVRDVARRYVNTRRPGKALVTLVRGYHPKLPLTLYARTLLSIVLNGSPRRMFWRKFEQA